ncbi:hypothetical protein [Argonema antarcticum]|uniref:hypothetical protein n=1 Tax=Argonema antarcticum TaxID=2942763 RepID=UPI0020133C35|nr:hypothetical protein [Argonema antarcticum]MCL1473298.1 hypothetical protein [Argonema antarcticum A004/B2]
MSPTPEPTQEPNILGKIASVVGLLGAALFFTGWIYRWSYFYFFQLEITTLDLPAQSFFIVPLQVFLGDGWAILKTVVALVFSAVAIHITLWLIQSIGNAIAEKIERFRSPIIVPMKKRQQSWISRQLKSLTEFSYTEFNSIKFLRSLLDEIVIVFWILIILYWLARWQGTADARRDAGSNSTLPVVTLVAPENRLALGRKFDQEFKSPTGKGYHFIGDKGLFNDLAPRLRTNTADSKDPIVWRLLMERGGWIYLFPALPPNANPNDRPPVIAIQESQLGEQLMILSHDVSKKRSP